MRSLSERDAAALLEVVGELARLDGPLAFPPHFLARLTQLFDCEAAGYSEYDRRNDGAIIACGSGGDVAVGESDSSAQYRRLKGSHPSCSHRERTGDWTTVYTVSDFASQREFRRTEIWQEEYRHAGINYWLDVGLPVRHGRTRVFIFTHDSHDFDDRSRLLLELLEPHLERRAAAVEQAAAAVDALTSVEEAGDEAHDVVLATARGTIEFASATSRARMERYFGKTNGRLPDDLAGMLSAGQETIVAHVPGRRLTIRAARVGDLLVLLLGEDDARVEQLTPRQRQITSAVAAGLTDAQIAERLGIAPATVGKHLEAIFTRLDVHTRTAAAAAYRG